jgi:hypothetical protein
MECSTRHHPRKRGATRTSAGSLLSPYILDDVAPTRREIEHARRSDVWVIGSR